MHFRGCLVNRGFHTVILKLQIEIMALYHTQNEIE